MHSIYEDPDIDGVLLVDARNAFNCPNKAAALHNIRWICPEIATILTNNYHAPAELFVGGDVLYSSEGTTQPRPCTAWPGCDSFITKLAGQVE